VQHLGVRAVGEGEGDRQQSPGLVWAPGVTKVAVKRFGSCAYWTAGAPIVVAVASVMREIVYVTS
jgi:hypothetical protein